MEREPILLTGSAHPQLAENVAKLLDLPVYPAIEGRFADGEARVKIPESVRKRDVFIIQSTCPPNVDRAYMELFFMTSAAVRSSAGEITVVMPYAGYARGDRQNEQRTSINISDVLKTLEERGANRFMIVDLHQDASIGSVKVAADLLLASCVLVPVMKDLIERERLSDVVIAAPDQQGTRRLEAYARLLRRSNVHIRNTAYISKERDPNAFNQSRVTGMTGNVEGAEVLTVDDIFDTGRSQRQAADEFVKAGAKSVRAIVGHGLFSDTIKPGLLPKSALELLRDSPIKQVVTTDTIRLRKDVLLATNLVKVVSIAPLLAAGIRCVHEGISITNYLDKYLKLYSDP